jgi:methyltransferase-like protein/protein-L-isoaspartate O-methyltransferase
VSDSEAYIRVPYPGLAFPQTHPDRLGLLATLHGLESVPAERARVLEVGCADGLNVVAMAAHTPGMQAVGFDIVEPSLGRRAVADLGVDNVRLERADLLDHRDWGEFDYIVAHGVYAWVADPVRDALMALFARSLAPHGVVFVSYNALPGARLRTMLREIALLHAGETEDAAERVERARELYEFLAPWAEDRPDAYGAVLAWELRRLRRLPRSVLAHDDLGARYDPVWLRDVVHHASRHGLRYLGDAEPDELRADRQPAAADEELDKLAGGDRVVWEQYADLLAGRAFRQTLLCRGDAPLDEAIEPRRLERLWFRATDSAGIGDAPEAEAFEWSENGESLNGSTGPAAVAQLALARPRTLSFGELRRALGGVDAETLAHALWRAFRAGEVDLEGAAPRYATAVGERPEASPVARWQAARGPELTSLRHEAVRLDDPLGRYLVRLCDGTRDRGQLLEALVAGVGTELSLVMEGEPVTDGETVRAQLADGLDASLRILAGLAMLKL